MKKLDVITGFLGTGKTTFLISYVEYLQSQGEHVAIIENDFGAINVDMLLLQNRFQESIDVEMVQGGGDYDTHKRRLKTKLIALGMDDYDRVIIEPSGIFNPEEVFDLLYESPIDRFYEMGNVIALVKGGEIKNYSKEAAAIFVNEIINAGGIIIREEEEHTKEELTALLAEFGCDRILKDKDFYAWEDFAGLSTCGYHRYFLQKTEFIKEEQFDTLFFFDFPENREALEAISKELFSDSSYGNVMRIKGFFQEENTWIEWNGVENQLEFHPVEVGQKVLILIGEHFQEEKIRERLEVE